MIISSKRYIHAIHTYNDTSYVNTYDVWSTLSKKITSTTLFCGFG